MQKLQNTGKKKQQGKQYNNIKETSNARRNLKPSRNIWTDGRETLERYNV